MKKFELTKRGFINPIWYRNTINKDYNCIVGPENSIQVEGETLHFVDETIPEGTEIKVFINRNFYCYLKTEYDLNQVEKQNRIKEEEQKLKDQRNTDRKEAEEFNKAISLGIKWDVGRKDVLSGLSEKSWGAGYKKNTVEHILILEDLHINKISRYEGDWLCTTESGSNGKNWSDSKVSRYIDGNNQEYQPKVTCKACLDMVERIKKIQNKKPAVKEEGVAKLFEKPDMENPVYEVFINGNPHYIQKLEGMNPSDTAWYEVEKDKKFGGWQMKNGVNPMDARFLGFTKKEAIEDLQKNYGNILNLNM